MKIPSLILAGSIAFSLNGTAQITDSLQRTGYLSAQFMPGKVLFKTGVTENATLNYNTNTAAMAYETANNYMVITNPEDIDTVFIGSQKFIPINGQFFEVEHVYKYITLLAKFKSNIKPLQEAPSHSGSETMSGESSSNVISSDGMPRKFKSNYKTVFSKEFYLKRNDRKSVYRISNQKQLIQAFPEKEVAINDYLSKKKVSFSNNEEVQDLLNTILSN